MQGFPLFEKAMQRRFAIRLAGLALLTVGLITSRSASYPRADQPSSSIEDTQQATTSKEARKPSVEESFKLSCARCHGKDGTGRVGRKSTPEPPDFANKLWQRSKTDLELREKILDGTGRGMPPFDAMFNSDQVNDLVRYVRSFASRGPKQR
jgi:mono/diheme cytochrome c family protein